MSLSPTKLLVLGGTGYVGSAICAAAVRRNLQPTSISRQGTPPASILRQPWSRHVEWIAGDALHPETFSSYLQEAQAIVHCIGILFEGNFNRLVSYSNSSGSGSTFESINRDTAIRVAQEAAQWKTTQSFCFISAQSAPFFLQRYLNAKREAETELLNHYGNAFRCAIFRPGVVYSYDRWSTLPTASLLSVGSCLNQIMKAYTGYSVQGCDAPTSLHLLAEAAIEACVNPNVKGIFDNDSMAAMLQSSM